MQKGVLQNVVDQDNNVDQNIHGLDQEMELNCTDSVSTVPPATIQWVIHSVQWKIGNPKWCMIVCTLQLRPDWLVIFR